MAHEGGNTDGGLSHPSFDRTDKVREYTVAETECGKKSDSPPLLGGVHGWAATPSFHIPRLKPKQERKEEYEAFFIFQKQKKEKCKGIFRLFSVLKYNPIMVDPLILRYIQ